MKRKTPVNLIIKNKHIGEEDKLLAEFVRSIQYFWDVAILGVR
jgi:hypothetical protein